MPEFSTYLANFTYKNQWNTQSSASAAAFYC